MIAKFKMGILITAAVLLSGCDGAVTPEDPGTPLWSLNGLVSDEGDLSDDQLSNVYAAVVWQRVENAVLSGYQIAQTIPVEVSFPLRFTLDIFELPPAEVMNDGEMATVLRGRGLYDPRDCDENCPELFDYRWVIGYVILFQDNNHNQTLDMTADGSTFVDYVVGAAPSYTLLYIESEVETPVAYRSDIHRGLSLFYGAPFSISETQIPIGEEIEITMEQNLVNQSFMCPSGHKHLALPRSWRTEKDKTCEVVPPADLSAHLSGMLVNGRDGACDPTGRIFQYFTGSDYFPTSLDEVCTDSELPPSSVTIEGYGFSILGKDEVPPQNWPCQGTFTSDWNHLVDDFLINRIMNDAGVPRSILMVQEDYDTCYGALNAVFDEEQYYRISIESAHVN